MSNSPPPEPPRRNSARPPKRPDKAPKRDRDDWLDAAREVLIEEGADRVKVEPLAKRLGVTTGSFYHHFSNRKELLDGLLDHWERTNSEPLFRAVKAAGDGGLQQIDALFRMWLDETEYDPAYDRAVRAWAHSSIPVRESVRRVDDSRIDLLTAIYRRLGYDDLRAFIRARIAYFHQVGYQAMDIAESSEQRRILYDLYCEALIGPVTAAP